MQRKWWHVVLIDFLQMLHKILSMGKLTPDIAYKLQTSSCPEVSLHSSLTIISFLASSESPSCKLFWPEDKKSRGHPALPFLIPAHGLSRAQDCRNHTSRHITGR
jgi:hypothetical protein